MFVYTDIQYKRKETVSCESYSIDGVTVNMEIYKKEGQCKREGGGGGCFTK